MWARAYIRYSIELWIQTYMEPVLLKYGKLTTKYPWIYRNVYSAVHIKCIKNWSRLHKVSVDNIKEDSQDMNVDSRATTRDELRWRNGTRPYSIIVSKCNRREKWRDTQKMTHWNICINMHIHKLPIMPSITRATATLLSSFADCCRDDDDDRWANIGRNTSSKSRLVHAHSP